MSEQSGVLPLQWAGVRRCCYTNRLHRRAHGGSFQMCGAKGTARFVDCACAKLTRTAVRHTPLQRNYLLLVYLKNYCIVDIDERSVFNKERNNFVATLKTRCLVFSTL